MGGKQHWIASVLFVLLLLLLKKKHNKYTRYVKRSIRIHKTKCFGVPMWFNLQSRSSVFICVLRFTWHLSRFEYNIHKMYTLCTLLSRQASRKCVFIYFSSVFFLAHLCSWTTATWMHMLWICAMWCDVFVCTSPHFMFVSRSLCVQCALCKSRSFYYD